MKRFSLFFAFLALLSIGLYWQDPYSSASAHSFDDGGSTPTPTPTRPPGGRDPAIVGGVDTQPNTYPWTAAIVQPNGDGTYSGAFCGGSLVAPGWVLTAAHCVVDAATGNVRAPEINAVLLGQTQLSTARPDQYIAVTQVIVFPQYDRVTTEADYTLLKLATSSAITPIPMASEADAALFATGVNATVIGWGLTADRTDGGAVSDTQKEVSVPIQDAAECTSRYATFTANMLCAGAAVTPPKDSCQGDSGGPLAVRNAANNGWVLAGIVSFGGKCGAGPAVYARVASQLTWINQQIKPAAAANVFLPFSPRTITTQ